MTDASGGKEPRKRGSAIISAWIGGGIGSRWHSSWYPHARTGAKSSARTGQYESQQPASRRSNDDLAGAEISV
jgi:hypothetical protein